MSKISTQITGILREAVSKSQSEIILKEIGKLFTNNILRRTRSGFGVSDTGQRQSRLKPLQQEYVKQRRNLVRKGDLSTKTSPETSNLTKSGDMLDSLTFSVSGNRVVITVSGETNKKKVESNAEKGREFLNVSDKDLKQMENTIDALLSRLLK